MYKMINYEIKQSNIALVTLNREAAANSLNKQILTELNLVVEDINNNKEIHCVIITGQGDKVFSAGADLKERESMNDQEVVQAVTLIGETINNVARIKVPVIAAMNGSAFGGGLELALACDIRLGAEGIMVGLTETSLAIIPGAGGTQRLARLIGPGRAKQMIFTAERIQAYKAYEYGILDKVFPKNNFSKHIIAYAEKIIKNGPLAVQLAKQSINEGLDLNIEEGLKLEHELYKKTIPSEDRKEGLAAFKEKRTPKYKGI